MTRPHTQRFLSDSNTGHAQQDASAPKGTVATLPEAVKAGKMPPNFKLGSV